MVAKRIKVVKEWLELKSVRDIQVFLGFTNSYQQFIQDFSKIAALLIAMLKRIMSLQVLIANKVLTTEELDGIEGGDESIEKCGKLLKTGKLSQSTKLSKSRKSKSKKTSKSQNSAKSEKKLSKSGNLTNFNAMKDKPKFLIPNATTAFNRLWLAFTKAPIL